MFRNPALRTNFRLPNKPEERGSRIGTFPDETISIPQSRLLTRLADEGVSALSTRRTICCTVDCSLPEMARLLPDQKAEK